MPLAYPESSAVDPAARLGYQRFRRVELVAPDEQVDGLARRFDDHPRELRADPDPEIPIESEAPDAAARPKARPIANDDETSVREDEAASYSGRDHVDALGRIEDPGQDLVSGFGELTHAVPRQVWRANQPGTSVGSERVCRGTQTGRGLVMGRSLPGGARQPLAGFVRAT